MSDLIDREEAIKAIIGKTNDEIVEQQAIDILLDLPSAEKTGKWIKENTDKSLSCLRGEDGGGDGMSECMTQEDAMKMSNERAIYILKDYSNFMLDRNGCPTSEMYFAVQKAIKSLEKTTQEWIPVSKRLPKKGGWYLVTWEDQFKTVRRVAVSEFIEPKGLTDIGHFEGFALCEIIAWMPLPEPYKGVMPNDKP